MFIQSSRFTGLAFVVLNVAASSVVFYDSSFRILHYLFSFFVSFCSTSTHFVSCLASLFRAGQLLYDQYLQRKPRSRVSKKSNETMPTKQKTTTKLEQNFIRSKLASSSLFSSFETNDLNELITKFQHMRVESGTKIITEGDTKDRRFFLIKTGRFEIRRSQMVLAQVASGVGIGELALFVSGRARGASVVSLERADLYVLSHSAFWEVTAKSLVSLKDRAILALKTASSFVQMFGNDNKAIEEVATKLFFKRFKPGDCILRRGHVGNAYYILLKGSVMIKGTDDLYRKLSSSIKVTGLYDNAMTRTQAQLVLANMFNLSTDRTSGNACVYVLSVSNHTDPVIRLEVRNIKEDETSKMCTAVTNSLTDLDLWKSHLKACSVHANWEGNVTLLDSVQDENNDDITLSNAGSTFGERSLLTDEPVSRDVVAKGAHGETILLAGLTKSSFQQLPTKMLNLIEEQLVREILSTHEVLAHLEYEDKLEVEKQVMYKSWKHKDYIIEENKPINALFVVRHGMCDITKLPYAKAAYQEAVRIESNVTVNSVLGEVSLREGTHATASVVARGPVSCYVFPKHIFDTYLKSSPYLKKIADRRKKDNIKTIKMQSLTNLTHNDFIWEHPLVLHRELSTVRLVCHRATQGYFACRVIGIKFIEAHRRHHRLVEGDSIFVYLCSLCNHVPLTFTSHTSHTRANVFLSVFLSTWYTL